MSTILKALRRLEDEKAPPVGQRPLREEVAKSGVLAARPRRRWRFAAVAGALGVAACAALLLSWSRILSPPPAAEAADSVAARPAPAEAPRANAAAAPAPVRPVEPPARRSPPAERAAQEIAELPPAALSSPVEVVQRPKAKPLVPEDPAPARTERSPAPAVASAPPEAEASEPASAAAESAPPAADALDASEASPTPASPAPAAASLRVEQTLWHPTPARRVAVLVVAGREAPLRVHEGDAVGTLVVAKIEPSGVIFSDGQASLRVGVGETR